MRIKILLSLMIISASVTGQIRFKDYFTDKVLRYDFMFSGNSQETSVYPMEMKEEPFTYYEDSQRYGGGGVCNYYSGTTAEMWLKR